MVLDQSKKFKKKSVGQKMTTEEFAAIVNKIEEDIITYDDLYEHFELFGRQEYVHRNGGFFALLDQFYPDQCGFGVF